jgi:diguanylate cyclase (GGDEF)-like protein
MDNSFEFLSKIIDSIPEHIVVINEIGEIRFVNKRWFMMRVIPFETEGNNYYVISHQNITERKLAEEEVKNLARIDGLTNIPNRRTFNEFLHQEWRRCHRLKKPISLAIIDLDHFKLLNDTHGHQAGDECLVRVGSVIKEYANRPDDICARYGGEEFALVWGDTTLEQSKSLAMNLLKVITSLKIENHSSPTGNYMTASIGLSTMIPDTGDEEGKLIGMADSMLYKAKESGRNWVMG